MDSNDTIDTLNDLVEISKDGEYGFHQAAEHASRTDLQQLFTQRARECAVAATELQGIVSRLGGDAEDSGTVSGAAHRGWATVKGKITGYTDLSLLEDTESAEDAALAAYRKALNETLLPDVRAVVERQLEGVKRNHLQVRTLRDQARLAPH